MMACAWIGFREFRELREQGGRYGFVVVTKLLKFLNLPVVPFLFYAPPQKKRVSVGLLLALFALEDVGKVGV